jgi:membrane protease YdiL (CAAX protease family)
VTAGFAAGCLVVAAWWLVLRAVVPDSWERSPAFDPYAAAGAFTFAVFNNAGEELVYRGYLFLLLARSYGKTAAVVSTCLLFTLLHIQSGVPWLSAVTVVLTSALLFAALFVRWQSVPLVLAFHVAVNVMQELIGLRISGLTMWMPHLAGSRVSAAQSNAVLGLTALLNTILAVAVFLSAARQDRSGRRVSAAASAPGQ